MHLSGKAKQIPRGASPASDDPIHITLNSAVAEDSVIGTSPNKCKRDATAEISTKSDAHYSKTNLNSTSFPSVQLLRGENPLDISSQKVSLPDETLSSFEHFQPYDLLTLPYEIRHMIYELVIGIDQQIHIKSNLKADDIPMSIIPCSDHSPAACLQNPVEITIHRSRLSQRSIIVDRGSSYQGLHCQGTAFFSHVLHTSSRPDVHTMTVCYNMQSGEQKISSKDISSCNQSAPFEDQTTSSSRMDSLRLLRTCRQIYDEARLVLYKKNTFVFSNLATFAAYFGIALPTEVYMPRLTYPDRLRAIHSMTKVELRGNVADMSCQAVPFSTASRLVRMGLGCLTRLTSFELELGYNWEDRFAAWRIDDCLFSKPSSLKRLVVTLRNLEEWTFDKKEFDQHELFAMHQEVLAFAKELMRRMVKEEGFNDMEEGLHDVDKRLSDAGSADEVWG